MHIVCTTKTAFSSEIYWKLSRWVSFWLALHLGGAIYFASIIVSGGLYHAGGTALSPLRTKAFCLASLALMKVELEGRGLLVLQLYPVQIAGPSVLLLLVANSLLCATQPVSVKSESRCDLKRPRTELCLQRLPCRWHTVHYCNWAGWRVCLWFGCSNAVFTILSRMLSFCLELSWN